MCKRLRPPENYRFAVAAGANEIQRRTPMKVSGKFLTAVAAGLLVVPWAMAQQQGQDQQPPKPPVPPGQTAGQQPPATPAEPATPPVNPEEEAGYKAFFDVPKAEHARAIEVGEEFLKKFPESRYREAVYTRLVTSYLNTDQVDKMYVTGEKALAINASNADVLAMLAFAVPRRLNSSDLDAAQKLAKMESYGKKAIEVIIAMPKPETLTEEEFAKAKADKLSMAHSGLGMVNYHRQRFADMATEFEEATKLNPSPDPVDFYLLGVAYQQTRRWADAVTAYEKCSESGPLMDRCKNSLANAKKMAAAAAPKQ
jgi:tetratricopeptide (TPR) repeat protein